MEALVARYFDITNQLLAKDPHCEYECEARINGFFVNDLSLGCLVERYDWKRITYKESRIKSTTNPKVMYRLRDNKIVCKTSLFKKEYKDLWCTLNISSEVNAEHRIKSMFHGKETYTVIRWSMVWQQCLIEVGYRVESNTYWIEIERMTTTKADDFIDVLEWVIQELQGTQYLTRYTDYHTIKSIFNKHISTYAKPITLTHANLVDLLTCSYISRKFDGTRIFLVIRFGKVFEVNLKEDVRHIMNIDKLDDTLTILDCEKVDNNIYVMDVPVYNNQNIEHMHTKHRLKLRYKYKSYFLIKPFYKFKTIDKVLELYHQTSSIPADGIIFIGKHYKKDIFKWKTINTVDLVVKADGLYTSDKQLLPMAHLGGTIDSICEFEYREGYLVYIKERPDKPFANSIKVVQSNIQGVIQEEFFNGASSFFMRKYHNTVKKDLLRFYRGKGVLIDIGTGQGGDVTKWKALKYKKIYCIEPNPELYAESILRGNPGILIHEPMSNYDCIQPHIQEKVDVVSAFFCLNLFTSADFAGLLSLLKNHTKNNAYFIGICMTQVKDDDNKCFTLDVQSNGIYQLTIHETRITNVKEKVLSLKDLASILRTIGFVKVSSRRLIKGRLLSKYEKKLSACYEKFVFRKVNR